MCVGVRVVTATMIKKSKGKKRGENERSQLDEEEEEQPGKLRTSCLFSVCFVVLCNAMNEWFTALAKRMKCWFSAFRHSCSQFIFISSPFPSTNKSWHQSYLHFVYQRRLRAPLSSLMKHATFLANERPSDPMHISRALFFFFRSVLWKRSKHVSSPCDQAWSEYDRRVGHEIENMTNLPEKERTEQEWETNEIYHLSECDDSLCLPQEMCLTGHQQ